MFLVIATSLIINNKLSCSPSPNNQNNFLNILNNLLIAELAAKRGISEIALENYIIAAEHSYDPSLAKIATEYAVELQAENTANLAAKLWAQKAPDDIQAQLTAIGIMLYTEESSVEKYINLALKVDASNLDEYLLDILEKLPDLYREKLTKIIYNLSDNAPKDPYINLIAAQIAANQIDIKTAEKKLKIAMKLKPDLTHAIELQAKLLHHYNKNVQPALKYLEEKLKIYPNNAELRMFYAMALVDNELYTQAQPHLEKLINHITYRGEALLLLSEINANNHDLVIAKKLINQALDIPKVADKAKYFLGKIAEYEQQYLQAINWYTSISESSDYHTESYIRAAFILSNQDNIIAALKIIRAAVPSTLIEQKQLILAEIDLLIANQELNQALNLANLFLQNLPYDLDFLYARIFITNLLNQPKLVEDDLHKILELDPDMELMPNNPAFMDSIGWLLYKMGKIQTSINILENAYFLSEDLYIAAHLGEVLWAAGNHNNATKILQQALIKAKAEHRHVIEKTLKKLNITLPITELKDARIIQTNN